MERYDVAIVGAGPDGLTAAALLAGAGRRVIVLEPSARAGGPAVTVDFYPGFRASLFADELAEIPPRLFWALDLGRRGALMIPSPASVCVSGDGASILYGDDERLARALPGSVAAGVLALRREIAGLHSDMATRTGASVAPRPRVRLFKRERSAPWPGERLGEVSLIDALEARVGDAALRLHLAADALTGRSASPFLAGTALHLLSLERSGMAAGGLGGLGEALVSAARQAGAEICCNAEVSDVLLVKKRWRRARAGGVVLAGGEEVAARAVLSTLDAKRSFLSLFAWNDLPPDLVKRAGQYRMRGACARVLFALDAPPQFSFGKSSDAVRGPIHVVGSLEELSRAHDAWRAAALPEAPPVTLRVPSLTDPRLAPAGKAVMTATLGSIPSRLFDGPWTLEKRERLVKIALAAAEKVAPGIGGRVLSSFVAVAPDIEEVLGITEGDLDGGEIAPDQALSFRPWRGMADGRTPIAGFYLAGPSAAPSPFLLGAAGQRAAQALMTDFGSGRLP